MSEELCDCGEGYYDSEEYNTCYSCYQERRAGYLSCIWCGRWHNPRYATCFQCRTIPERDEAGTWLRQHILARDRFTCQECGSTEALQVDHVIPCAKGGNARPWNLLTRCTPCNQRKGATWFRGCRYEADRARLLREYFVCLRVYLDREQREALRAEVEDWRREHIRPQQHLTPIR